MERGYQCVSRSWPIHFPIIILIKVRLAWVSPQTACVKTNLTFHFTLLDAGLPDLKSVYLQDDGGFANLARNYPSYYFDDEQANPDLLGRAFTGAWLSNAYFMLYSNLTNLENPDQLNEDFTSMNLSAINSFVGKKFNISNTTSQLASWQSNVVFKDLVSAYINGINGISDIVEIGNYSLANPGTFCSSLKILLRLSFAV